MYAGALRMDGPSLGNLELLLGADGGPEGSLLARIDTCASPGMPVSCASCCLAMNAKLKGSFLWQCLARLRD